MRKARVTVLLVLLSLLPSVSVVAGAQTGQGAVQTFINDLATVVPVVLFFLAILAHRYDDRYALVLLASSMASAMAFNALGTHNTLAFYFPGQTVTVQLNINGPVSVYVGDSYTYTITSSNPSIPVNPEWEVINATTGQVVESGVGTSITFTPSAPGKYLIVAWYYGNLSNGSNVYGYGDKAVTAVQYSVLNWIESSIENALEGLINAINGAIASFGWWLDSFMPSINGLVYAPPLNTMVEGIYNNVERMVMGLALLFIGASVAYNAIRGFYGDIVDLAGDVLYKLGVWAFFTANGYIIYQYVAGFLNNLVEFTVGNVLATIQVDFVAGQASYAGLMALLSAVGFGFARSPSQFVTDIMLFYVGLWAMSVIRQAMILATVALIPLASTLWLFEWTRKFADAIVDILAGLLLAGVVTGFTFAFIQMSFGGPLLFMVGGAIAGIELALSVGMSFFTLQPHSHLSNLTRGSKSLLPTSYERKKDNGSQSSGSSGGGGNAGNTGNTGSTQVVGVREIREPRRDVQNDQGKSYYM